MPGDAAFTTNFGETIAPYGDGICSGGCREIDDGDVGESLPGYAGATGAVRKDRERPGASADRLVVELVMEALHRHEWPRTELDIQATEATPLAA